MIVFVENNYLQNMNDNIFIIGFKIFTSNECMFNVFYSITFFK